MGLGDGVFELSNCLWCTLTIIASPFTKNNATPFD